LLASAGVPAVIAMQGDVKMLTLEQFMPAFFTELLRAEDEGQIDRAMAAARAQVAGHRRDWWAPALFMRLRSGRIAWHEPGFRPREGEAGFDQWPKWPALIRTIHRGQCTPILGPGLLDCLLGPVPEVARDWARKYHFPLSPHQREDLPTVAQYVSINQARLFPHEELGEHLHAKILAHYREILGADLQAATVGQLSEVVEKVGAWRRQQDPADPHRVLARLPCRVYITANPGNLLTAALEDPELEPRRTPHVEVCVWNDRLARAHIPYGGDPTPEEPLVYQLFGRLDEPRSMVVTQDDYFDYLIGVTRNRALIPPVVRDSLADSLLLFLGFRVDDWSFRALLRSIVQQSGSSLLDDYAHVAVQLDPGGEQAADPEAARRYLEQYFSRTAVSIYWGRTEDFVRELRDQWNRKYGGERPL
jgi:hypothetical protein